MKTTLKAKLVIMLSFTIFMNCSKDSVKEDEKFIYGTIQATVNDSFKTLKPLGPASSADQGRTGVYGYKDEIGITIGFPDTVGIYQFENPKVYAKLTLGDPFDFFDANNDGPTIDYNAIEGSVNLIETNGVRVRGTFNFLGKSYDGDILKVLDGEFDVVK